MGSLVGRGEHEPAAVLGAGHGGAVLHGEQHEPEPFFTPNPDTPASTKTSGCENALIDPCGLRKHEHISIITFYSLLQHLIRIPLWLNWHGTFLIADDSL